MSERLMYSWDDDEGGHTICSECLRAFGNAAACQKEANAQDAVCDMCEYDAKGENDK
jgi:hypothetical protein